MRPEAVGKPAVTGTSVQRARLRQTARPRLLLRSALDPMWSGAKRDARVSAWHVCATACPTKSQTPKSSDQLTPKYAGIIIRGPIRKAFLVDIGFDLVTRALVPPLSTLERANRRTAVLAVDGPPQAVPSVL